MLILAHIFAMLVSYGTVIAFTPIFSQTRQLNFSGRLVPSSLGIAFILVTTLGWLIWPPNLSGEPTLLPVIVLLCFCLFGLMDDLLGNSDHKGFSGHIAATVNLQLTTGVLKALLGGILALVVSWQLGAGLLTIVVRALIIVLTANLINLLDLRPGRAGKTFVILSILLVLIWPQLYWLLFLTASVLGYLPWDLRAKVMMGDAGANPIGAVLGFAAASVLGGWLRLVVLLILVVLNIGSEWLSFSQIIENNPVLRWLDQLGRTE